MLGLVKEFEFSEVYSNISKFLNDKMKVISVINEKGKLKEFYDQSELKYSTLKRGKFLAKLTGAKKLAKTIDENKIDIIHLHWSKDLQVAVLAKLMSKRKPKIVQSRHMNMTRFKDDFYHKFIYKNIDVMIAITKQMKEQLIKFIPEDIRPKIEMSYLGSKEIETFLNNEQKSILAQKYNIKQNNFIVGIFGRIQKEKGQYLVIDAVAKLRDEGIKDIDILIVGAPMSENYLKEIKNRVKTLKLEEKTTFTGFTKEAQELMQLVDCSVMATNKETFGLVVIESMHAKTPVISTNSGGPIEVIEEEKTGLFFEPKDAKGLSDKIKLLYKNNELKETLTQNAYLKAKESFSLEKQFDEVYKILNRV